MPSITPFRSALIVGAILSTLTLGAMLGSAQSPVDILTRLAVLEAHMAELHAHIAVKTETINGLKGPHVIGVPARAAPSVPHRSQNVLRPAGAEGGDCSPVSVSNIGLSAGRVLDIHVDGERGRQWHG